MKPAIAGVLMHPIKNSAPVIKNARRICNILEIFMGTPLLVVDRAASRRSSLREPRFAPQLRQLTCQTATNATATMTCGICGQGEISRTVKFADALGAFLRTGPHAPDPSLALLDPAYSTVTDFARLRGWSTSVPRSRRAAAEYE